MLCAKGAAVLQSKSINVEDAANELINMLCEAPAEEEEEEEEEGEGEEEGEEREEGAEQRSHISPAGSRLASSHAGSQRSARPQSTRAEAMARRRREQRESMEESANELLAHFNHRNLEALLKVTRNTLETLRKRITTSSMLSYIKGEAKFQCTHFILTVIYAFLYLIFYNHFI